MKLCLQVHTYLSNNKKPQQISFTTHQQHQPKEDAKTKRAKTKRAIGQANENIKSRLKKIIFFKNFCG